MARYALLGDSYITRLERFGFEFNTRETGEVRYFGKGGMSTQNISAPLWDRLIAYSPTHVFIHLGGNDISADVTAEQIFERVVETVRLLYSSGVRLVFIGKILPRSHPRGMSIPSYRSKCEGVNRLLRQRYHRYFIITRVNPSRHLLPDGVHLNTKGLFRFAYKVQRAFNLRT